MRFKRFPQRPVIALPPTTPIHGAKNKVHELLLELSALSTSPISTPQSASTSSTPQNEEVMYTLHVPFRWVSAFPRVFYTHHSNQVGNKKPWITVSLAEAVTYLNVDHFRIKTTVHDHKTRISKEEWPEGVEVFKSNFNRTELEVARNALATLCRKIIDGDTQLRKDFLLYPHQQQNMFLFWSIDGNINFQMCMQRLKKYDEDLFKYISQHTIHYLQDMGVDENKLQSDWSNTDSEGTFYNFMNRNCTFEIAYYFPRNGSLLSHVDNVIPIDLPDKKHGCLKRQGAIHTLNLNDQTKYFDLFPVWQPHNTSDESAESAYRLETHFGQTTKLSGLNSRFRFSHAIPSGSEREGYTACWKWEELDTRVLQKCSGLILVHDNEDIEYDENRILWRRKGAIPLGRS